jgi:Domain of unknown function (DUF4145)
VKNLRLEKGIIPLTKYGETPYSLIEDAGFVHALVPFLLVTWRDWRSEMGMTVTTLESHGEKIHFSLSGVCPHCGHNSVCTMVSQAHREIVPPVQPGGTRYPLNWQSERMAAVTQCQGCKKYVLAVVTRAAAQNQSSQPSAQPFVYEAHYPMGKPDDSIDEGIPGEIGDDFKEALRCMFVDAYKAAVCMCGRALEGACSDLQAEGDTLEEKIDSLETKRIISEPLKEMAHHIRLTRNRGAHIPKNSQQLAEQPVKEHAEALIAFTRQFFCTFTRCVQN